MFSSLFSVFSALLLGLSYLVNAAPVKPTELLAIAPTITSPTAGVVWPAGSKQNVTWLTNNIPPEAQNYTLAVLLGFFANDSENLDIKHPLATQVPIMQGSVIVTLPPNATYRTNYTVVVIGDSGNASPPFTITNSY
ncbi:hypothetical protein EV363DRAFT_935584 [Boletus edulis]|uniref:Yeast cell wall synthesis Kre9/Knh1-like N-terminal domain-containing protein n=1 Tax=Boletus edulis BED1 TaxID=1328754 RepID=A0AAD4BYW4_BOLED|nr:hypothetical protein EV363DRAFT_935584 [Boletus edulis]KAF8442899.1 hypothetical protein L210DRAFT_3143969 [Boletus edulis BED1]